MMEDKTGWEIMFDGTDRGVLGRELLPPRDQRPSDVWTTPTRRRYTKTGIYKRQPIRDVWATQGADKWR